MYRTISKVAESCLRGSGRSDMALACRVLSPEIRRVLAKLTGHFGRECKVHKGTNHEQKILLN